MIEHIRLIVHIRLTPPRVESTLVCFIQLLLKVQCFQAIGFKLTQPAPPYNVATYDIMPPPAAKEKALGEVRIVNYTGAGLSVGEVREEVQQVEHHIRLTVCVQCSSVCVGVLGRRCSRLNTTSG